MFAIRKLLGVGVSGSGAPVGGRILADQPVDRLTDQVRVSGVSPVLLDQVEDRSAQAGPPAVRLRLLDELVETALVEGRREPGAGPFDRTVP